MTFRMSQREIAQLNRIARTVSSGEEFIQGHSGKRQYATKAEAETETCRGYLCDHCGMYHRTTMTPKERRNRNAKRNKYKAAR